MVVDLDACAHSWVAGNRLRVSVAGSDWPNTVAPPAPVTLTVHGGSLDLPTLVGDFPVPIFSPGAQHSSETADGVSWEIPATMCSGGPPTRASLGDEQVSHRTRQEHLPRP